MNVLLVVPFKTNGTAGVGRIVRSLQKSLVEQGHEAYLLMAGDTNTLQPVTDLDWENTFAMAFRSATVPQALLKGWLAFCLRLPLTLVTLARFLRRQRIDVVHINYPADALAPLAWLRPFARWRLVVALQGSELNDLALRTWSARRFLRSVLAQADVLTACSRSLLEKLRAAWPAYVAKTLVIPSANPIGVEKAASVSLDGLPERFVLSVGSLIHRKGHDVLIRAIRAARDRGCRLDVVVVGGGPEGKRLQTLARDLGVADQVRLTGEVPHNAMSAYYARARYFVLATRGEGMPLAIAEAMSFNLAVIATAVDGIPEIVRDGDNGLLVPPEDVDALATVLIRLEQDQVLRRDLAARGRDWALQEHTWARYTKRNLEAYRIALGGCREEARA